MKPIIIIGSGMAGYTVAREFRKLDKSTPMHIITGDDGGFYAKPMLSNAFAQNKHPAQLISQTAAQMAEQLNARILPFTRVSRIDGENKTVLTSEGNFDYEKLVIAVGAQPIRLPIAGNAASHVISINNVTDYAKLRESIAEIGQKARITILGAGLIGCEFADDLASAGHSVTVIDPNALPLAALAPKPISTALQSALESRGVNFKLDTTATSIDQHPDNTSELTICLSNGEIINANIVLSAVGLRADLRLAQTSQLETERGILVDTSGQTSTENIYALGDCAQYTNPDDGSRPVLPYIAPIMTAARAIARTLTGNITQIDLKPAPVIIKTPSYPIALIAPPPHSVALGRWEHEQIGETNISRFYDASNVMKGFAVAPHESKVRAALLAELTTQSVEIN